VGSAALVLVTLAFARPWYWDLIVAVASLFTLAATFLCLRVLWHRPRPTRGRSLALAAAAVLCGVGLVAMAGIAAVVDGAALSGAEPDLAYHGGAVLSDPVLYQVFWGPEWLQAGPSPALQEAAAVERRLARSNWTGALLASNFGVVSFTSGGCWVDPTPPARPGLPAASMASGPFPDEVRAAFGGAHVLTPCPGTPAASPPAVLPADALVAVWLPSDVPYALGGVAAHGAVPWPGRTQGLAATGLPGSYVDWGRRSCASDPACGALPSYASPAYALSHELVETITNPYGGGWFSDPPLGWTARYVLNHGPPSLFGVPLVYPGEVADLCQPGGAAAGNRVLVGRLDPGGPAVAPFFRPHRGCVG
jgi:hypothetical protein